MIKSLKGVLFLSILGFNANVLAESVTADVYAVIRKGVTLTKVRDLNLGSIQLGTAPGNFIMTADNAGGNTITCPATFTCNGVQQSAQFSVTGVDTQIISYSVTNARLSNGTDTIDFTSALHTGAVSPYTFATGTGLTQQFYVGGTITNLSNAQKPGDYSTAKAGGTPIHFTVNY